MIVIAWMFRIVKTKLFWNTSKGTINKIFNLQEKSKSKTSNKNKNLNNKTNILIKEITENIENFNYNIAIVNIINFINYLYRVKEDISENVFKESFQKFLLVLSPFAPHICEELYTGKEKFISIESWPKPGKIDKKLNYVDNFISETISDIHNVLKLAKIHTPKKIILGTASDWKYKLYQDFIDLKSKNINDIINFIKKEKRTYPKKETITIIKSLVKKQTPKFILDPKTEFDALKTELRFLEKEFKLKIEIEKDSEKALPNKLSIKIE